MANICTEYLTCCLFCVFLDAFLYPFLTTEVNLHWPIPFLPRTPLLSLSQPMSSVHQQSALLSSLSHLYEGSQWEKNEPELSECLFKFLHRCMCRGIMASPNQILPTLTFSCLLLTSGGEIMPNSGLDVLQFSRKVWDCMTLIPFELTVYLFVKYYSEIRLFKIWKTAIFLLVNSAQVLHTKTGLHFLHFEQNFNMRWALTLINIPFFHLQCLHFFFLRYYLVLGLLYSNLI